jgi:hypothetical protein
MPIFIPNFTVIQFHTYLMEILLYLNLGLGVLGIFLMFAFRGKGTNDLPELRQKVIELQNSLAKIEGNLKDDFRMNREENASLGKTNREELNKAIAFFLGEKY